ncbi:MAG: CBM9 family sugar-binding protein, partial [Gammaproteobacteria bacterium]|nr:CBM9 family sugar-binding protein [Gammaproteobacteria bacterium]
MRLFGTKTRTTSLAAGCALLITACDNHLDLHNDQLQMVPPVVISESRAIELPNLLASIELGDGREIGMTRLDNNTWTAVVRFPANSSQTIGINWSERYKGQILELASATTEFSVGTEASSVNLGDLPYATDFDADEDGKTNLAERNAGTDPYSAPVPGQPDVNVIIPRVDPDNTPAIDGQGVIYDANVLRLVGEWSAAVQEDRLDETLYIENLMIDINADQKDGDPFHRWAALHDGTWLYVLVVSDDVGAHHSDSTDPPQDDNLELYFDGNNSKNNKYEDADDRFIQMPLRELNSELPNSHLSVNRRITAGFGSAPLPQTVEFSVGLGTGPLSFRNA